MQLNPSEISDLIKKRIEGFEATSEARSEGTIVSLTDGIVRIHGLADVMQGEMIDFGNNLFGLALNLLDRVRRAFRGIWGQLGHKATRCPLRSIKEALIVAPFGGDSKTKDCPGLSTRPE